MHCLTDRYKRSRYDFKIACQKFFFHNLTKLIVNKKIAKILTGIDVC